MAAIVELLLGFLVEVFREFQQWWLGRARLRAAAPAGPPEAARSEPPAPLPEVEPFVAELLVRHAGRHVGVAVGVLRDGQTWVMGSGTPGLGSASPPGANTIFEIGSVTKVFTATLLAAMVDEGLLALEDPVQRYLPPGVELPVRGRPITLADLATHTAGLPRLPHGDRRLPKLRRVRAGHPHRGGRALELGALRGRARLPNPRADRRLVSPILGSWSDREPEVRLAIGNLGEDGAEVASGEGPAERLGDPPVVSWKPRMRSASSSQQPKLLGVSALRCRIEKTIRGTVVMTCSTRRRTPRCRSTASGRDH